jgi:hypothetical protein
VRIVLALATLLVVVAAVGGYKVHRRTQADPTFCSAACHHNRDLAGDWHTKGHDAVDCQKCHAYGERLGAKLWWQSLTGGQDKPAPHGKPAAQTCVSCHEKNPVEWRLVAATQGHREHRALKDTDCLSCHGKAMHTTQASEKDCLACHKDQRLHKSTPQAETCISCHAFAVSKKNAQKPTTLACEQCHADQKNLAASTSAATRPMRTVDRHALHGEIDCKLCHNPHGRKPKVQPGQPVCARCHQFETLEIGGVAVPKGPAGHRDCEKCHQPHAPLKKALDTCITCHESKVAPKQPGPPPSALKHQSCASCHLPHSWTPQKNACMQCHEEKAAIVLAKSPEPHKACEKCHDVHGPAPTGAVCVTCHAPKKPHVAKAPARHKDCTACHNPHSPLPNDTRGACATCHVSQLAQVVKDGPAGHNKEGCYGCHKPHENPLPGADLCAKCHADKAKAVAAAGPTKHQACGSCHQSHKFKIAEPKEACGKCHQSVLQAGGSHNGDCKKCHSLHGEPGVQVSACMQCHQTIQAAFKPPPKNEQHAKCKSCHEPHRTAKTAPAKCASCHQPKVEVAKTWPAESAHAGECQKCHQPHDVRAKKVCAECHEKEQASALGGKHQCQQCHAPHKEAPGTGPAWWTRCASCHQKQVAGTKALGPKHSDCKNCHQPHKFAVPTCVSCHQGIQEKGAHGVKEHAAKCNACHDPHQKQSPARAQCLACHTNKQSHQPEAQRCQACHPFQ